MYTGFLAFLGCGLNIKHRTFATTSCTPTVTMSTKKEWCTEPIEITVVNSSEIKKEITVVAFTKNVLDDSAKTQFVVWQSLQVQSKAKFEYTSDISVMAERTIEGVTYQSGPFPARPGDSWIFYQDKKESAPCLQQGIR